jgi:hypothetical protein
MRVACLDCSSGISGARGTKGGVLLRSAVLFGGGLLTFFKRGVISKVRCTPVARLLKEGGKAVEGASIFRPITTGFQQPPERLPWWLASVLFSRCASMQPDAVGEM